MKKELGILLLIFIATVGLSSAASAQPIATTAHGPNTYGQGGHGNYGNYGNRYGNYGNRYGNYGRWTIFRRFIVSSAFAVNIIRHRYHSPMFRVTAAYIGHHRFVVTVWRRFFYRR
jgi:hypothetical protein